MSKYKVAFQKLEQFLETYILQNPKVMLELAVQ